MRFEQLKCIVEVANTGSITAAAKRLFISQQAVSMNIKQLEEELHCTLLIREKDGVSFSPKGQDTVQFAKKMLNDKEIFCNRMRQTEETDEIVQINICSISSVTNVVLPNVLDRMEAKQRKISLRITLKDELDALFHHVQNNQCDVGLLTFNKDELTERFVQYAVDLQMETLAIDEMAYVINKKTLNNDIAQITQEEFYSFRQSLYNIIPAERHLHSAESNSIVWSNDAEFHRAMLERKGTLVMMPGLAYQYFFSHKKYTSVTVEDMSEFPLLHAAVYRKDAPEYIKEFVNLIRLEMHMK